MPLCLLKYEKGHFGISSARALGKFSFPPWSKFGSEITSGGAGGDVRVWRGTNARAQLKSYKSIRHKQYEKKKWLINTYADKLIK